jgi:NitT/TauT family transport system permease protein
MTARAAAGPIVLVVFWWCASALGTSDSVLLPSPERVASRIGTLAGTGAFWMDLGRTTTRWLSGFGLGVLAAVPVGLLLGSSRRLYESFEFLIEFFRALPVTALFPLFLLAFGIEDASKIAMVFTATFFPVLLNSAAGCFNSSDVRLRVASVFGASALQRFYTVVVFEAAPQILVGVRTALSISLIVVVLAEMMIGADRGVGQRLFDSYSRNDSAQIYALIVVLGTVGYLANRVVLRMERRFIFWAGQ